MILIIRQSRRSFKQESAVRNQEVEVQQPVTFTWLKNLLKNQASKNIVIMRYKSDVRGLKYLQLVQYHASHMPTC